MQEKHDDILWHTSQQYGGSPDKSNPGYSEQLAVKMYCRYIYIYIYVQQLLTCSTSQKMLIVACCLFSVFPQDECGSLFFLTWLILLLHYHSSTANRTKGKVLEYSCQLTINITSDIKARRKVFEDFYKRELCWWNT